MNLMTQLFVFGERIWTVDDVGRNISIVLWELCNPKSAQCESNGQDDKFNLLV